MSIRVTYPNNEKPEMPTGLEYIVAVCMLHVGMTHITEENFNTFRYRVHMVEQITGDGGFILTETGLRQLTEDELRLFIGTKWNTPKTTDTEFRKVISLAWFNLNTESFCRKTNLESDEIKVKN